MPRKPREKKASPTPAVPDVTSVTATSSPGELIPPPSLFPMEHIRQTIEAVTKMRPGEASAIIDGQLELIAIHSNQVVVSMLKDIISGHPLARGKLVGDFATLVSANESIARQKIAWTKMGIFDDLGGEQRKDPADMTLEEWEAHYKPKLLAPAPSHE